MLTASLSNHTGDVISQVFVQFGGQGPNMGIREHGAVISGDLMNVCATDSDCGTGTVCQMHSPATDGASRPLEPLVSRLPPEVQTTVPALMTPSLGMMMTPSRM